MKICTKCNEKFDSGKFCKFCGSALQDEVQEIHCKGCGAILKDDAKFCPMCGLKYEANEIDAETPDDDEQLEDGEAEYSQSLDLMYPDEPEDADEAKAFELMKIAASKKYTDAYYFLGAYYENGKGCEQDFNKAFEWYKKSEQERDNWGRYGLAKCYRNGWGCKENLNRAFELLTKACENVEEAPTPAFYALGLFYEMGYGCEQNFDLAFTWYKRSAEEGNADARYKIGLCFLNGYGCEIDQDYGIQLIQEAAENGSEDAQKLIDEANSDDSGEGMSEDNKRVFGKAGAGAVAGAAIGSIVPGVGTVLGAAIGGLAGLFKGVNDEEKR